MEDKTEVVLIYQPFYPSKPDDLEISQEDWEAYCRDMEEMQMAYERAVYG